jgi:hypothetical protein
MANSITCKFICGGGKPCGRTLSSREIYLSHLKMIHQVQPGDDDSFVNLTDSATKSTDVVYQCPFVDEREQRCVIKFVTRWGCERHLIFKHGAVTNNDVECGYHQLDPETLKRKLAALKRGQTRNSPENTTSTKSETPEGTAVSNKTAPLGESIKTSKNAAVSQKLTSSGTRDGKDETKLVANNSSIKRHDVQEHPDCKKKESKLFVDHISQSIHESRGHENTKNTGSANRKLASVVDGTKETITKESPQLLSETTGTFCMLKQPFSTHERQKVRSERCNLTHRPIGELLLQNSATLIDNVDL